MNQAQQAYLSAKFEGATQMQAHVLVLDEVCLQLTRAAAATGHYDIAGRCRASNQVLTLLGHLENWAPLLGDPLLSDSLVALYAFVRTQLLAAQVGAQPRSFLDISELLVGTREAWQQKELLHMGGPVALAQLGSMQITKEGHDSAKRAWQG